MDQIFADGTTDISITGGVVRIDFFHYGTGQGPDGKTEREFSHRLLMSAEGFLQMYTAADEVIRILLERGLIQRAPRDGATVVSAPAAAAPATPVSPNF
ncbi:hypothetical protein [Novispirillum itersonii]|uniref:hypothetical protein n=1 Tax=Novispirillum itersonii TaxID=189 RepID=UPI00039A017D|nr:hypothetical protein [Novispirillum itersonii]